MNIVEGIVRVFLENLYWGVLGVGVWVAFRLGVARNYTQVVITIIVTAIITVFCMKPELIGQFGTTLSGLLTF